MIMLRMVKMEEKLMFLITGWQLSPSQPPLPGGACGGQPHRRGPGHRPEHRRDQDQGDLGQGVEELVHPERDPVEQRR